MCNFKGAWWALLNHVNHEYVLTMKNKVSNTIVVFCPVVELMVEGDVDSWAVGEVKVDKVVCLFWVDEIIEGLNIIIQFYMYFSH